MGKNPRRACAARAFALLRRAGLRALDTAWSQPSTHPAVSEQLEKRQFMSGTASHGLLAKLDSTLTNDYQHYLQSGDSTSGSIEIQAYANVGYRAKLVTALKNLKSANVSGSGREVDALVRISDLGKIATLKSLRFADVTSVIVNTGSVTSQGDLADIAATARAAYNLSGSGITVGILSDSFNNNVNKSITDTFSTDVASGDLPANTQILSDNVPGTDEGRAIAQVIYDSAPGATIKFATAESTMSTMASNIAALTAAGCKIIVDDVTYPTEPMFEDGAIAQAVETAISKGVTYITAAGNLAEQSYGSTWQSGKTYTNGQIPKDPAALNAPSQIYAGTSFNFATSGPVNDLQSFQLGPGKSIQLSVQWDSPYYSASGGSGNAIQADAYVLNAAGTMIEGGSASLVTGKDPVQYFTFTNPSTTTTNTYNLLLITENGSSAPDYIKYVDFAGQATNWAFSASGTNASTIFGHANAAGVIAVGAANYANTPAYGVNPTVLETFTGEGGTPIYFNTAGGKLTTPLLRQEPIVVGPDNVANTFFGKFVSNSPPTYAFSGTSAAAASVAAVVALLKYVNPSLTPASISNILSLTALPINSSPNYLAGYGLVQTVPAVARAVGNVTGTVYSDNNANSIFNTGEPGIAGVTVFIDLNKDGKLDAGDPTAVTSSNGTFAFYNQASGTGIVVRAIQPSGYIGTVTSQTINIVGLNTTSGVNFGFFPDNYTATSGQYMLQLNATNPSNVNILSGSTVLYTAPLSLVPSVSFNFNGPNNSLTVNFANGNPIPAGGATFNVTGNTTGNSLIVNTTSANDTVDVNVDVTTIDGSIVASSGIQSEVINGNGGNDVFSISGAEPAGEALTFNGGAGVVDDTLNIYDVLPNNGVGTTFNAGSNTLDQNTLNMTEGTFTFSGNPAVQDANLTFNLFSTPYIDDNGLPQTNYSSVVFNSGALGSGINQRTIASANITAGCSIRLAAPASHKDRAVLITNSISMAPTGILDLSGNDMIINSSSGSLSTLTPLLSTGFNGGSWNGPGIQSSAAASDTTHLTAIAVVQNNGSGSPLYGTGTTLGLFDNVNPNPSAILLKYTYYGDTNLNGQVDGTDYSSTDSGYIQSQTGWANGDFNYDGAVNGSDYTLLDNAFNTQGNSL